MNMWSKGKNLWCEITHQSFPLVNVEDGDVSAMKDKKSYGVRGKE